MARKRYTTEQIIGMLREADVRLSQSEPIGLICRGIGNFRAELLSMAACVRRSEA